jgi:hypothetical protein
MSLVTCINVTCIRDLHSRGVVRAGTRIDAQDVPLRTPKRERTEEKSKRQKKEEPERLVAHMTTHSVEAIYTNMVDAHKVLPCSATATASSAEMNFP